MSLPKKLTLIFICVMLAAALALNVSLSLVLSSQSTQTIEQEQLQMRENCNNYINQYLLTESASRNEDGLRSVAPWLGSDIASVLGHPVALYTSGMTPLYSPPIFGNVSSLDLEYAVAGKSAYSFVTKKSVTAVYFSFPILCGEDQIGIARVYTDYSRLYQTTSRILTFALIFSLCSTVVVSLFSSLLISRAMRPVKRLTNAIKTFSTADETDLSEDLSRKDELGVLARGYDGMAKTIHNQMNTITREKALLDNLLKNKKKFYDGVTHELKTPITIIKGYAEMILQTNAADREFCRTGAEKIVEESKRLTGMVGTLLEAAGDDADGAVPFPVDLAAMLRGLCEALSLRAQRYGVALQCEFCETAFVVGKAEKLRRLFANLLDNALKYGEPGRPVLMRLTREVCFMIENDVPKEILDTDKLFLPFYRDSDAKETGSVGLGLSICREIVQEHSGTIRAEMCADSRVRFTVCLPPAEPEATS